MPRHESQTSRNRLGDFLARCAHQEAASVFSFSRLARELEAHGAPRQLVARARAARADESRHAAIVGALARERGGELSPVRIESLHVRSLEEMALENAVEGCVLETYGAAIGAHQAECAEKRHRQDRRHHRIISATVPDEFAQHDSFLGHVFLSMSEHARKPLNSGLS